jgi:CheY-like chemotaxis protein
MDQAAAVVGFVPVPRRDIGVPMAKILVIDDDPGMRRVTSRALEAAGHVVAVYANGRGAVRDIEKDPPDLLITDIFMPEMEGLETIREARTRRPSLPIIAMSGFTFDERLPRHRRKVRRGCEPQKAVPAGRVDRPGQPPADRWRRLNRGTARSWRRRLGCRRRQ